MRPVRFAAPVLLLTSLMLAIILAPLLLSGCGASAREKTLRTTFVAINAARGGFKTFDADHQAHIVADAKSLEEGQVALATYRKDREAVLALFEGAYHALTAAILAENDAKTLANALGIWGELSKALDDLKKAKGPP